MLEAHRSGGSASSPKGWAVATSSELIVMREVLMANQAGMLRGAVQGRYQRVGEAMIGPGHDVESTFRRKVKDQSIRPQSISTGGGG